MFKKVILALILPAMVKSATYEIEMEHDEDSNLYYVEAKVGSQK